MRSHPVSFVKIPACVLIIAVCLGSIGVSQETDSLRSAVLGSKVTDEQSDVSETETQAANTNNDTPTESRIAELEASIKQLSGRKRTRDESAQLKQLKFELKVAEGIATQLRKTRPTREKGGKQTSANANDTFVVAKIEVASRSKIADVTFSSITGELVNTNELFDFLKQTPQGGFRDYRIFSRHESDNSAEAALASVREEYDVYKEREKQMLAYIAARNKQLASVNQSRRC